MEAIFPVAVPGLKTEPPLKVLTSTSSPFRIAAPTSIALSTGSPTSISSDDLGMKRTRPRSGVSRVFRVGN